MDAIRITITRGCNADGTGGTVVDDAAAVLGSLPDSTPLLDVACAAFADAYGIHKIPAPTVEDPAAMAEVSLFRNLSYRLRLFATEIVSGYAAKTAAAAAAAQAKQQTELAISALNVIESTTQDTP